uniref:Uncharacterized protein n=1 Tax=Brassica oleracea TaxID=3712 RepID=A0A3P6C1E4_BRAOL|nr:unnamed protein product [Brassica oleracea]
MAMWTAVRQLYRLYYANVFILNICHPEVFGVAKDIEAVATK